MRRFLIFLLLGTPLGLLVSLALSDSLSRRVWGPMSLAIFGFDVIGVIPSAIVGGFDAMLAAGKIPYRIAMTAAIGGVICFALLYWAFEHRAFAMLVGAIPAAVCSWLSGARQNQDGAA